MKRLILAALLLVSPAYAADLTITWTDNSTNELGFRIERRLGSGPVDFYDGVATVGINVVTYEDTGLAPDTEYCYRIIAFNEFGETTTAEVCATTDDTAAITITTASPLPNAQIGVAYGGSSMLSMGCQGGDGGPYTYAVTVGTLPSAVALAADGSWSGTPGAGTAGLHTFTIECDDGSDTGTKEFTLNVLANSPAITTTVLPNGVDNVVYTSGAIEAVCPLPPCVLSKASGTYCVGTTLSDTSPPGEISGTPTTPEVCNFVLRITDNLSQTADQALTMSVEAAAVVITVDVVPGAIDASVTYGSNDLDSDTNCTATLSLGSSVVSVQESLSGGTFRQALFSNLTPNTEYEVEVDCDDAASVVSETFTTLDGVDEDTVTVTLKIKPNSILVGVESVLVEWGEEGLGVFETSTTEECAAGCTVDIGPLSRAKTYLLRFSWLDEDDNVLASSQRNRRIVP